MKIKNSSLILAAITLVMVPFTLQSASWVVWPGESLQAAIDTAAPGDNITVQTGAYDENIIITKGIDIRGAGGEVLVTGTLAVTDVTLPVYIADIRFGKAGTTGMTLSGVDQDVRLDRCRIDYDGNLIVDGGKVYFYKCTFTNRAILANTDWTFQRCTVEADIDSDDSTAKFIKSTVNSVDHRQGEITLFQSTVNEGVVIYQNISNSNSWVAYSDLRWLEVTGGNAEIVGNYFNGRNLNRTFVTLGGSNGNYIVRNNSLWDDDSFYDGYSGRWHGGRFGIMILNDSGLSKVYNNVLSDIRSGVSIEASPQSVELRGNTHRDLRNNGQSWSGATYSVQSAFAGTLITHNNFENAISGGVASDNINSDPVYVSGFAGSPDFLKLAVGSPGIDQGPPDPIFNDLDESRNDISAYGGHSYDPDGRTTSNPVILSGSVSPLYIKRGGAITIEARAAVVAEP